MNISEKRASNQSRNVLAENKQLATKDIDKAVLGNIRMLRGDKPQKRMTGLVSMRSLHRWHISHYSFNAWTFFVTKRKRMQVMQVVQANFSAPANLLPHRSTLHSMMPFSLAHQSTSPFL